MFYGGGGGEVIVVVFIVVFKLTACTVRLYVMKPPSSSGNL